MSKEIIDRYLKGQCTATEAAAIEKQLAENPQDWSHLLPKEDWDNQDTTKSYTKEQELLKKITQELPFPQKRSIRLAPIVKVAALLLAALTGYWYLQQAPLSSPHTALNQHTDTLINEVETNLYYINSGNENMRLVASDGSIITLYPHSEIKYAEDFDSQSERSLQLKGKAKFEVAKDPSKPFRVYSKGMSTTALGTVFIVDELRNDETRVRLLEGSIEVATAVKNAERNLVKRINQPEELTVAYVQAKIVNSKSLNSNVKDRASFFQEKDNSLQFKNLAVEEIIAILEQNYGISILHNSPSLRDKYFSGSFKSTETVYENIIQEINYLHALNLSLKKP